MNSETEILYKLLNVKNECQKQIQCVDSILEYERKHVLGFINAFMPEFGPLLKNILLCNQLTWSPISILKKNLDLKEAFDIFRDSSFQRKLKNNQERSQRSFLIINDAIFMYCVTLFLCQVITYLFEGHGMYHKNKIKTHEELMKKAPNDFEKLWDLDIKSEEMISLPTEVQSQINVIKFLDIRSENGAARKLAANLFVMYFGLHFKINNNNRAAMNKIAHLLLRQPYPDTHANKTRDITAKTRQLI